MAINETQSARSATLRQDEAVSYNMRRQAFPAIRWGAILAGVAVGISIQLALTLLGIATGLSTTEVTQGEGVGTGPLVWAGVSMLVAAFVGGYVAARMSGLKRKADGILHGAVSWAVTTIIFAVLATSVGTSLVGGVFNNMSQLAQAGMQGGGSPVAAVMQSQGARLDQASMQQFQQHLQAGQREPAIQLLVSKLGVDQTRASAIVDQALIITGSPQSASSQGRQTSENAVQRAGTAAWVVFLAVALALAIGIGGGALGAAGSRRVSWSSPQA
ncbi:hypothetical protein [Noviherbaspirillum sp. ST9]|uniref:hypothetical protein n=1 Tax=Noviherbaspirillum sp. ST9 TaxID=3401606 RepID=UPI003B58B02B